MNQRFNILAMSTLLVMTMATSAFAQAVFTVSSGNQPRGRMNGHAELAGGVTLAKLSGENVGADGGTVVLDYGVPITNDVDGDAAATNEITVSVCGVDSETPGDDNEADVSDNTITVTVADGACTGANAAIDVSGVRLSLVGSGQDSIVAVVTSTGGVRLPSGSNMVSVINAVVDELTDDGVDAAQPLILTRHTGDPADEDVEMFHLVIEENTVDSFDGANIDLEFSGIPDGVTITVDAWVATAEAYDDEMVNTDMLRLADDTVTPNIAAIENNDQVSIGDEGDMEDTVTDTDNETTVFIGANSFNLDDDATNTDEGTGGSLMPTAIDVVIVRGSIDLGDDDNLEELLPLNLEIQVTADVGPIGDDDDPEIPRFASDMTTAVTVIESTSAQTVMEVAYVLSDGAYDTGIAVSNMTDDQAGAVHFALFMNGEEMEYSTPSMMQPQTTMSVLLSEVLRMAGHSGSFRGYMIITADFTKADAGVFVSDFAGFTAGATVRTNN